jgi:RNA polymerase primary sigma factor
MATRPDEVLVAAADDDREATPLRLQIATQYLVERAMQRAFITRDELDAVLPSGQDSSGQIEAIVGALNGLGIKVVEDAAAGRADTAYAHPELRIAGGAEDEEDEREAERLLARINARLDEAHARADKLLARP